MSSHGEDVDSDLENELPQPNINPYDVLDIPKTATAAEVKKAYYRLALKHHPDKVEEHLKNTAHESFQKIAFAYAILSDPVRRERFDKTGSTSESLADSDGFNWSEYYSQQFKEVISEEIEKFAQEYKGSEQEKDDLLEAYSSHQGDMDMIYEVVMLSNVLEDDERFRKIIDSAIKDKKVEPYKPYVKETKKARDARVKAAKSEAAEAEEYAKELGVHDKLFGKKQGKKGSKKADAEADLQALILGKSRDKHQDFMAQLEAKYAPKPKKDRSVSKKRKLKTEKEAKKANKKGEAEELEEDEFEGFDDSKSENEPSEEEFQRAAEKVKAHKAAFDAMNGPVGGTRSSKRTKR